MHQKHEWESRGPSLFFTAWISWRPLQWGCWAAIESALCGGWVAHWSADSHAVSCWCACESSRYCPKHFSPCHPRGKCRPTILALTGCALTGCAGEWTSGWRVLFVHLLSVILPSKSHLKLEPSAMRSTVCTSRRVQKNMKVIKMRSMRYLREHVIRVWY